MIIIGAPPMSTPSGGDACADDDRLDPSIERRQHLVRPVQHGVEVVDRQRVGGLHEHRRKVEQGEVKACDGTEEPRTGAPRRPVQVGVGIGAGVDQLAVGGHHVDREHALAGPPPQTAVPSLAALEEVAAQTRRSGSARPGRGSRAIG